MNQHSVIYHIFIDRFAGFDPGADDSRPVWVGGTINGIREKLLYLKELGINWIWLSPFSSASVYHGYHVTDYYTVDEHLGTKEDLKHLVQECHSSNIKVMMDFVPNHCSTKHPFFLDAQKNTKSAYRNWFYFTKWPNKYLSFLHFDNEMVKWNLENEETSAYIIENTLYWLREFSFDGIRLDHAIGPAHDFWKKYKTSLQEKHPGVILIGEVWWSNIQLQHLKTFRSKNALRYLLYKKLTGKEEASMKSYESILDGVLDFTFYRYIREFAHGRISQKRLSRKLTNHYAHYSANYLLPTFLDNHDTNRYLFEAQDKTERLQRAAQVQFFLPQPKIIYYGTEIGMTQEKDMRKMKKHGDLLVRKKMIWDNNKWDMELFEFYKQIIHETTRRK